jgi:hypothetical protein
MENLVSKETNVIQIWTVLFSLQDMKYSQETCPDGKGVHSHKPTNVTNVSSCLPLNKATRDMFLDTRDLNHLSVRTVNIGVQGRIAWKCMRLWCIGNCLSFKDEINASEINMCWNYSMTFMHKRTPVISKRIKMEVNKLVRNILGHFYIYA